MEIIIDLRGEVGRCPECEELVPIRYNVMFDKYELSCCNKTYSIFPFPSLHEAEVVSPDVPRTPSPVSDILDPVPDILDKEGSVAAYDAAMKRLADLYKGQS